MIANCIFVHQPKECSCCVDNASKLQCLLNKRHLMVSEQGRVRLMEVLDEELKNKNRYKTISGQEGRPHG